MYYPDTKKSKKAKEVWKAIKTELGDNPLTSIRYNKKTKVWVGTYLFTGVGITYYPRIPIVKDDGQKK